ncbi:type II toxin-antitoxin system RelE/ParE family toxin [Mycoplasmatota bacterium]|nr:type II toxin-antitoxin system RelE/ParE family toxin [Mycoplasmatota bacterium]
MGKKIFKRSKKNLFKFERSIQLQILAGIQKVSSNPLPDVGYGKPLGNKGENNLTGFFKIKYKGIGIRVVYSLVMDSKIMNILVISKRDDNFCYEYANKIYQKYGDSVFQDIFEKVEIKNK